MGKREIYAATGAVAVIAIVGGVGGWMAMGRQGSRAGDGTLEPLPAVSPSPAPGPSAFEFAAKGPSAGNPPASGNPPDAAPTLAPTPTPSPVELVVHVAGAVKKPGVYHLKPGDRVEQAIQAAGGYKANADQDILNLAEPLRDADKVEVPVRAATPAPAKAGAAPVQVAPTPARPVIVHGSAPDGAGTKGDGEPPHGRILGKEPPVVAAALTSGGKGKGGGGRSGGEGKPDKLRTPGEGTVNINTAGAEELQRLPGVGPAMSGRILEYRQQIGRFTSPEQLRDVKGVGEKTYAKMQPFIRIN